MLKVSGQFAYVNILTISTWPLDASTPRTHTHTLVSLMEENCLNVIYVRLHTTDITVPCRLGCGVQGDFLQYFTPGTGTLIWAGQTVVRDALKEEGPQLMCLEEAQCRRFPEY